jgi:hypothetical protein
VCPIEAPDLEPYPSNPTDRSRIVWDVLGFEPLPLASQRTLSTGDTTPRKLLPFLRIVGSNPGLPQRIERTRATRAIPRVCDVRVCVRPRVRTPGGVSGGSCVLSLGLGCTPLLNSRPNYPVWNVSPTRRWKRLSEPVTRHGDTVRDVLPRSLGPTRIDMTVHLNKRSSVSGGYLKGGFPKTVKHFRLSGGWWGALLGHALSCESECGGEGSQR